MKKISKSQQTLTRKGYLTQKPRGAQAHCISNTKPVQFSIMDTLRYNLILRPEPEGGFTVTVPALSGCVTYGRNLTEAKKMAHDAIKGYLASLRKHKETINKTPYHGCLSL